VVTVVGTNSWLPRAANIGFRVVLALLAIAMICLVGNTICDRMFGSLDGTVVARQDLRAAGVPWNYTEYKIRGAHETFETYYYADTGWDGSLPRDLPVGSRIAKKGGGLDYVVDGRRYPFPVPLYAAIFGMALVFAVLALRRPRHGRQSD
jgi:hypothetical protein